MLKAILFLTILQISAASFTSDVQTAPCNCPSVTNLYKTSSSSTTYSCAWDAADNSVLEYRVWYVRSEDNYNSGTFTTTSKSYTFTGLTSGHYSFYVQVVCSGGTSEYVGIEDVVFI